MDTRSPLSNLFLQSVRDHLALISQLESQQETLLQVALRMADAIRTGHKILWCGNGGSAADSQHLAAELVGRFQRNRPGWASIALTTDTSILTAVANDYGFDTIFSRQVEALGREGDVLVALSTSGNSDNVCRAVQAARTLGIFTVSMTGEGGGKLCELAEARLCIPSRDTARVQECHILLGHVLCQCIESELADGFPGL